MDDKAAGAGNGVRPAGGQTGVPDPECGLDAVPNLAHLTQVAAATRAMLGW